MSSIFNREPGEEKQSPSAADLRLEQETEHLRKRKSVRHVEQVKGQVQAVTGCFVCVLLGLIFMDPVIHSFVKGDAIRAYLYLRAYDTNGKTEALEQSGLFTPGELRQLNKREGDFHRFFPSVTEANRMAQSVVAYAERVRHLHGGRPEQLDWLNKIRYYIFIQFGVPLPTEWSAISPNVETGG